MSSISDAFLRRSATSGEITADVVRALTALSVVVAAVGWGFVELAVFMLALLGTLVPRAVAVRSALDVAIGLTCLVAAWSNVFDWYSTVIGWDKVVHFALTAVLAALVVVIARRTAFLPPIEGHRFGHVVMATLSGLGLGALWELGEWAGHTFVDQRVVVGYIDTIGDLGADVAGAFVAGLALPALVGTVRIHTDRIGEERAQNAVDRRETTTLGP